MKSFTPVTETTIKRKLSRNVIFSTNTTKWLVRGIFKLRRRQKEKQTASREIRPFSRWEHTHSWILNYWFEAELAVSLSAWLTICKRNIDRPDDRLAANQQNSLKQYSEKRFYKGKGEINKPFFVFIFHVTNLKFIISHQY